MMFWILFACNGDKENVVPTDPQSSDDCLSDEQYYAEEIDPIVQSSCVACHSEAGIASGTRMVLGDNVASNYLSVSSMAAVIEDDRYMLLVKPTNQHPDGHGGGQPIAQGSDNYEKLELFVARVNEVVDDCAVDADLSEVITDESCANEGEARRLLRRLSHVEYDNSIRDVFGLSGSWAVNFAADNVSHGYDNNAVALQVSPLLLDQYANAAEQIAAAVIANGIQAQVSCASSNRACARQFLEEKGTELFRRPLSESDIENHLEMYDLAAEDGFSEGMTWVITAMLQSPHFLYRSELGERQDDDSFALTSWEIASELSYLFWQTTPDSTLLELAAEDQLTDPEVIEAQVTRLLQDERAAEVMTQMSDQWLGLRGLEFVARDTEVYGDLTADLRTAMATETNWFIQTHFQENTPFANLLTDQYSWMNGTLADHYGLTDHGLTDFAQVDLSTEERYGGLLSHGSLMTVHALPTSSSPIHRGLLVREKFLCQELPPPPANLDTSPPVVDPSLSTRERYAQHSSDPSCSGCHDLIDPIGFAFEHYDGIGRWRDIDGEHPIDASGAILQSLETDGSFDGVSGLSAQLAASSEVSACYVHQWFVFGMGRGDVEEEEVSCGLTAAVSEYETQGATLQAAPAALTKLQRLHTRYGEIGEMDTLAREDDGGTVDPVLDTGEEVDTAEPVIPVEDISVDVVENSNWGSGYCSSVTVTNNGTIENTWVITLQINGTISSLWNAISEEVSGGLQFSGVDWNATIQPNQSAEFGFCANL